MQLRKKLIALGLTSAFVTGGAAVGLATYNWTSTGSGSGSASSVSIGSSSISSAVPGAGLYPDSPARTMTVTVDNPNPYPVNVTAITVDNSGHATSVTDANGADIHTTCALTSVTATPPAAVAGVVSPSSGTGTAIDPKTGSTNGSRQYALTVTMAQGADPTCAGAIFGFGLGANLVQSGFGS